MYPGYSLTGGLVGLCFTLGEMKVFITGECVLSYALDKVDAPPAPAKDPPSTVGATPADESTREGEKQVAEQQQEAPPSVVSGPPPSTIPPIPAVPS